MTEEEAKTKWCPMVRDVRMTNGNLEIGSGYCKASGCMMWVETKPAERFGVKTGRHTASAHGYCGMGGKP